VIILLKSKYWSIFSFVFLSILISESSINAQVSPDQQIELNKYDSHIANLKKQKKYKMVGYYLYKSASIYLRVGEHQKSIDKFLESAQYYEQIGNYNNKKKIYSNVAFVYADMGQLKNAKKYYKKSLEISRRLNNRIDVSAGLMEVASIEIYLKDYSKAQTSLEEALKIANILNDATLLRTCYRLLSQLHKNIGNQKKSDQYYNSFLAYDRQLKGESTQNNNEQANKSNATENENSIIASNKNASQTMKYELLELRKRYSEDSLITTIAVREDVINRIEGKNSLINKINKNLKQDSKHLQQTVDNQKQQLFWYNLVISLLFVIALAGILLYLQKNKAYKQLEQEFNNLKVEITKIKKEDNLVDDVKS